MDVGLPTCQLLRLKRIMLEADCSALGFWLDPICIPTNSSWKRRAIEKMTLVYGLAEKVIVLDRDLLNRRGSNILRGISILLSDWVTRIWTLQEAVLPGDKLFVAFADGVKHMNTILNDWWDPEIEPSKSLVVATGMTVLLESELLMTGNSLLGIVENFHNRVTTRPEDEALCLAILLDVDVGTLPHAANVTDVLHTLRFVEQDVIFAPGPRSERTGFKWCPATFLSKSRRQVYLTQQIRAPLGEKGIKMKKNVAMIGCVNFEGLEASKSVADQVFLLQSTQDIESTYIAAFCDDSVGAAPAHLRPRRLRDAALLFEKGPGHLLQGADNRASRKRCDGQR
jgi:hypothetical protein